MPIVKNSSSSSIHQFLAVPATKTKESRSDSVDSQTSTISVPKVVPRNKSFSFYAPPSPSVHDLSKLARNIFKSYVTGQKDISVDNMDNLEVKELLKDLSSITIMDTKAERNAIKTKDILEKYNGKLYEEMNENLLKSLKQASPKNQNLYAHVADFNDNLLYAMQGDGDGLSNIIASSLSQSPTNSSSVPASLEEQIKYFEDVILKNAVSDGNSLKTHEEKSKSEIEYRGSFMQTERTIPQPAHVDFDWKVLKAQRKSLHIGFFPLTEEGMFLQLWKDDFLYSDNHKIYGDVIYIPYKTILLVPSDTIHGGGFKYGEGGNLRFHLYVSSPLPMQSREKLDTGLPKHQMNKYTEEHDRRKELCDRFVNSVCLERLTTDGVFFDI